MLLYLCRLRSAGGWAGFGQEPRLSGGAWTAGSCSQDNVRSPHRSFDEARGNKEGLEALTDTCGEELCGRALLRVALARSVAWRVAEPHQMELRLLATGDGIGVPVLLVNPKKSHQSTLAGITMTVRRLTAQRQPSFVLQGSTAIDPVSLVSPPGPWPDLNGIEPQSQRCFFVPSRGPPNLVECVNPVRARHAATGRKFFDHARTRMASATSEMESRRTLWAS